MVQAAGDVPPEAMARMTAAEARLYPLAMVDPGRYERATTLVGLVAAELRRSCRSVDEVLARREELLAALPRLADGSGVGMADLVPADVVDAASALVCRQLQAHRAAAAWHARIDEARRAGREWLVVEAGPDGGDGRGPPERGAAPAHRLGGGQHGRGRHLGWHCDVPPRARPGRGDGPRRGHGPGTRARPGSGHRSSPTVSGGRRRSSGSRRSSPPALDTSGTSTFAMEDRSCRVVNALGAP